MKFYAQKGSLLKFSSDYTVLPFPLSQDERAPAKKKKARTEKSPRLPQSASAEVNATLSKLDKELDGQLARFFKKQSATPRPGKRYEIPVAAGSKREVLTIRISFIAGKKGSAPAADDWRRLGGDAFLAAVRSGAPSLTLSLEHVTASSLDAVAQAITEGMTLADYSFGRYKTPGGAKKQESKKLEKVTLLLSSAPKPSLKAALKKGAAFGRAVCGARDLVNTPPNDLFPRDLVKEAKRVAGSSRRVSLKVYDRRALTRMGAGSLLAVSQGSEQEPYLLHLHYRPASRSKKRKVIALVGKGITFDSGGLSIKTGKGMEEMKMDMAGAACVLNVLRGVIEAGDSSFAHELHVVIPTCENMINGQAVRPGDIVYAMNGKSIEILNTDAEGRLILADALSYLERIKPDVIVDIATLTGACIVALGNDYAGLFANADSLRDQIMGAGKIAGERFWPLPLAEEYRPSIDSPTAQIKNIASNGPGAIIGALFLREFVPPKSEWAHLDIAGPAYQSKSTEYSIPGGTGFGVLTLLNFLSDGQL